MPRKLDLIQGQVAQTGWHISDDYTSTEIQSMRVDTSRKEASLNAIPSPFARMHLFESAFELLYKDERERTDQAGENIKKLVSDCFDVYELIYNWNSHRRDGKELSIHRWDFESEINILKNSTFEGHRLLGRTFELYLKQDGLRYRDNGEYCKEILIIKLGNHVIAGTSPFTGFFTTANDLSDLELINPLTNRKYFSKERQFKERRPEIQAYIAGMLFENQILENTAGTMISYLDRYRNTINSEGLLLEELKNPNDSTITFFGQNLQSNQQKVFSDYHEDYIIKINYRVNDEFFHLPNFSNGEADRRYDYIPVLKSGFFQDFPDARAVKERVMIREIDPESIELTIRHENNTFKKKFRKNVIKGEDGQLIDLKEDLNYKINIGIFPFIKIMDNEEYNNLYKTMLVVQDLTYTYSNKDFRIDFYNNNRKLSEGSAGINFKREDRSILERSNSECGSIYYTTNAPFERLEIVFRKNENTEIYFTLLPKWQEKNLGRNNMKYAVDFGTTTTFVAYSDQQNNTPRPFTVDKDKLQVAMLNKPKEQGLATVTNSFEWTFDFLESVVLQSEEFLPSVILDRNNEEYKFPTRTAIYQKQQLEENEMTLLGNTNISFIYQKKPTTYTGVDQEFFYNLKWNLENDLKTRKRIKLFIEELAYMIRTHMLLHDSNPKAGEITLFLPLSFTEGSKFHYKDLWKSTVKEIFHWNDVEINKRLKFISESEAPYYYLHGKSDIDNNECVVTLDIGGGSTDIMVFRKNKPELGSSVNFGSNVIWGNGYVKYPDSKQNGIYRDLVKDVTQRLSSTELKDLNFRLNKEKSKYGSDEILNFWLYNDDKTGVTELLKKGKYTLSYLLHFAALIHYVSKVLKENNIQAPTCIIFSGNGSRYIDLIQDVSLIKDFCHRVLQFEFGTEIRAPQVILPPADRKEATCFGGLFKEGNAVPKTYTYLGVSDSGIKSYEDLDSKKEEVLQEVNRNFLEFIDRFFEINEILNFKAKFNIDAPLLQIKEHIKEKSKQHLTEGYTRRRSYTRESDDVTDSLFFYSLIGHLYDINNLEDSDLDEYFPKDVYYAYMFDEFTRFSNEELKAKIAPDSMFIIEVRRDNPSEGDLSFVDDEQVKRKVVRLFDKLKDILNFDEYPTDSSKLYVAEKGKVKREGDHWAIKKKIEVNFINEG